MTFRTGPARLFTDETVEEMRDLVEQGWTQVALARRYECSVTTIRKTLDEEFRRRTQAWNNAYRVLHPERKLLSLAQARSRSRKPPLEFTLTIGDIVIPTLCPACRKAIVVGGKQGDTAGGSLDRTDSERGYTPDNVDVICLRCNLLKNNGTVWDFMLMVHYLWQRRLASGQAVPTEWLEELSALEGLIEQLRLKALLAS